MPQSTIGPSEITTEGRLDDALSTPGAGVAEALASARGDIVILGAGGKVGPTLALMARRALDDGGSSADVIAVARFSDPRTKDLLDAAGVRTVTADLSRPGEVDALPDAAAVFHLVAMKFGTADAEPRTWWFNTAIPTMVANRYAGVPSVVYSTGNVYPMVPVWSGGATESTLPEPVGDYAQSCLGRERVFQYAAETLGTPVTIFRLNYACELRYGVVADIASRVLARQPVDVTMPAVNVVWQGDANTWALRSLELARCPATLLNATGPETVAVRRIAELVGERAGIDPTFTGEEAGDALLSDASELISHFGYPSMGVRELVQRVTDWLLAGGRQLGKATKFQQRDGRY